MRLDEYTSCDGVALADLVNRKQIAPSEPLSLATQALEAINPRINAVIGTTPEEADKALSSLRPHAPLAGVPFLIKDIGAHFAHVTSELGSRFFRGLEFPTDTELAARFRSAGLITLGRSNTPEFGCNLSTEPVLYGATRNPWNPAHSPGGSSGGSAAAVAAGIVPLAHANDGAGSIRAPASACGLVGLKPSRGRQPTGPDSDELVFGLGYELVVSRTVRDTAVAMDATCAPEEGSRLLLPKSELSYLEHSKRDPRRLRIAFSRAPQDIPGTHPECVAGVEAAAKLCADLGHDVFEAQPSLQTLDAISIWLHFTSAFVAKGVGDYEAATGKRATPAHFEATVWQILEQGRRLGALEFMTGFDRMKRLNMQLSRFFRGCDVWLTPTMLQPPPPLGYLNADEASLSAEDFVYKWAVIAGYMPLFNVSGQPAITLPLAQSSSGLPLGMHFAGHMGDEGTLLELAGQLERAAPWSHRRPEIFAGESR